MSRCKASRGDAAKAAGTKGQSHVGSTRKWRLPTTHRDRHETLQKGLGTVRGDNSRKDGTTVHTTWCRADSAHLVQFVHSVVRTVVLCTDMLCVYVVHVSRARAVIRFALLRFTSRTALGIHSFIHEPHAARTERARTTLHTRLDSRLLRNVCEHTLPLSSFALLCVVVVPPAVDVLVHGRRVLLLLCRWWDVTCSPLVPCTVYLARLPEQYERAAGGQFGATLTRRLRFSLSSPISPCFFLRDQKLSSGVLLLTFMTTHLFYASFADT